MGDRPDVPRLVDHSAKFPRRSKADSAADELRGIGYTVAVGRRGFRDVLLEARRSGPVDLVSAEAFTREVLSIVARNGGNYDGWGGEVEE